MQLQHLGFRPNNPSWHLVFLGLIVAAIGLIWVLVASVPWLGRLPGDIMLQKGNTRERPLLISHCNVRPAEHFASRPDVDRAVFFSLENSLLTAVVLSPGASYSAWEPRAWERYFLIPFSTRSLYMIAANGKSTSTTSCSDSTVIVP